MFEWIKKHKALFIIICVMIFIALIGVPFAINLLFKVDTKINVFQAEWSAGDALGSLIESSFNSPFSSN